VAEITFWLDVIDKTLNFLGINYCEAAQPVYLRLLFAQSLMCVFMTCGDTRILGFRKMRTSGDLSSSNTMRLVNLL
jgi:hypothetical protein